MSSARAIVIHGHFYQPPRENPWLEAVEVQDSAAPYHDWNARITAECYAPNTAARRVDAANRIIDIVNNFERISFNVGPTLLAWLAREAPVVHAKIVEADRASVAARGGHGNAIAQVYNHMIMPLASRRDKVTQVQLGAGGFPAAVRAGAGRHVAAGDGRRRRDAGGAGRGRGQVHHPVAGAGPPRAPDRRRGVGRGRRSGSIPAVPISGAVRADLSLALFFYDAPISRAIAFEGTAAQRRADDRPASGRASREARSWPQLVHCATDGESYGHHSRFGEMALAAALRTLEGGSHARSSPTTARSWPPTPRLTRSRSARTPHGAAPTASSAGGRIAGAAVRPDSQQRWRGPLRAALDWLRDQIDPFYEAAGGRLPQGPVGGARRLRRHRARPRPATAGGVPGQPPGGPARRRRPPVDAAACSSCSATGCSCTPRVAGSSTRSRGWSRYRS